MVEAVFLDERFDARKAFGIVVVLRRHIARNAGLMPRRPEQVCSSADETTARSSGSPRCNRRVRLARQATFVAIFLGPSKCSLLSSCSHVDVVASALRAL